MASADGRPTIEYYHHEDPTHPFTKEEKIKLLALELKDLVTTDGVGWEKETFDAQRGIKEQEKELDSVLKVVLITEERWQTIKIHFNKGL